MHEIAALADTCSVFRNGQYVATFEHGSKTDAQIVEMMIGRDIETVLRIKQLLYEEGFTIAGAKKRLLVSLTFTPPTYCLSPRFSTRANSFSVRDPNFCSKPIRQLTTVAASAASRAQWTMPPARVTDSPSCSR